MRIRALSILSLAGSITTSFAAGHGEPPVEAPFAKGEDSLCVNDWWNRPANEIIDLKVPRDQVVCFGIYTVNNRILKLSAQLYPLYPEETREVRLEIQKDGKWTEIGREKVNDIGWSKRNKCRRPSAASYAGLDLDAAAVPRLFAPNGEHHAIPHKFCGRTRPALPPCADRRR